jgi:hypothetical protein
MVRVSLLVCLLLGPVAPALAQPADAVVMLVADLKDGRSTLGAGFFVSPDGRLLTAYHLIAGASRIRIITSKTWTDQVVVQAVAASRDLAVLRVTGLRTRSPFIALGLDTPPTQFTSGPLDVYGPPPTVASEGSRVRVGSATQIASGAPRHPTTRRPVFSLRNVDVIQLDTAIDSRLTGAPVVFKGTAVGITLGSLNTRGATAWAIPVKYSVDATPINRTPERVDEWPRQTLLAPARIEPASSATLGPGLVAALDRLGRFIDTHTALQDRAMNELTTLGNQAIERCHRAADLAIFRYGIRHRVDDIAPDADEEFEQALGAYATRHRYYEAQLLGLDAPSVINELTTELQRYFDSVPPSPTTRARRDRALGHARELAGGNAIAGQLTARVAVFEQLAESIDNAEVLEDLQRSAERATVSFRALLDATKETNDAASQLALATHVIGSLFN